MEKYPEQFQIWKPAHNVLTLDFNELAIYCEHKDAAFIRGRCYLNLTKTKSLLNDSSLRVNEDLVRILKKSRQ